MFEMQRTSLNRELTAKLASLDKSQAIIEFAPDGAILSANENFLNTVGYALPEIKGKHHSMFVDPSERTSLSYRQFWEALNRGEYQQTEFRRIARDGKEIWLQASYNPIVDKHGKTVKVVKYATDITRQKQENADFAGQLEAISKSQAVIQFKMDGTILEANENFLQAVGYGFPEIHGKHHGMFLDPVQRASLDYRQFWESLNRGEYQSGEYKRVGKCGKELWLQASYNPILDLSGKPFKVVKYATDITQRKLQNADYSGQIAAISKSQAVIQFNMDGTIIDANENFLKAVGYGLNEIQSKHHGMFVDPLERSGNDYRQFWEALNRGEYQSGEFKRFGKGGGELWLQASYNPILDMNGKPFKVVKYATDITAQVTRRHKNEQAQRAITQNMDEIVGAISLATQQSSVASEASLQTSTNVQAIASGAEELNASVGEIAQSMTKSKTAVDEAVERVKLADNATKRLTSAAQSMSGIVELIQNIASQINLLALNATIESARAGEAGKGFAVVANEVKNLANQAKAATDQISKEIDGVQIVSSDVATTLEVITQSIQSVREFVMSTASAVEEQSAVAREMSSNMQVASKAVVTITGNISEIAQATESANVSTSRVREAVQAFSA